jgi:hypothetical protein
METHVGGGLAVHIVDKREGIEDGGPGNVIGCLRVEIFKVAGVDFWEVGE